MVQEAWKAVSLTRSNVVTRTTKIMLCCSSKIREDVSKVFSFKRTSGVFQILRFLPKAILFRLIKINIPRACRGRRGTW
jgi:hypothetical protein